MNKLFLLSLIIVQGCSATFVKQDRVEPISSEDVVMIHSDGRMTIRSREGIVLNEKVAIAIAQAVLEPIYGTEKIESEKPFKAKLEGNIWTVTGSIPPLSFGGVATVQIDKETAKIISLYHSK